MSEYVVEIIWKDELQGICNYSIGLLLIEKEKRDPD